MTVQTRAQLNTAADTDLPDNSAGAITAAKIRAIVKNLADSTFNLGSDSALNPLTDDGGALGDATHRWSDLFLAAGAVINFANGDVTITHATDALAFAGAASGYSFDALVKPAANDGAALGDTTHQFSDLFLASAGVINWANGDITITGQTNQLFFAGANSGYVFDHLLSPLTDDGAALGTSSLSFSDLFLASGAVINFASGDVTITHASNALAIAGASNGYSFDAVIKPAASDGAALGSATVMWSDLFLAAGAVINFNNGDVTVTHATDALAFAGAANGYSFDAVINPAASDGAALGSATVMWSDAFLAAGAVINFNNGDVTITHGTDLLTFAGAANGFSFGSKLFPTTDDGAALGDGTHEFSDLFLASGAVINFANGDATITHSSNLLTFAGASSGYSFDALMDISGAAAGQIKFPASQNASANANTLDDYEEGSFTPTVNGTSTAGAGTYSNQVGRYTKIGNVVHFEIELTWSAHTGTGNMFVTGLPFTAAGYAPCSIAYSNLTYASPPIASVTGGTNSIGVTIAATGAAAGNIPIDTAAQINVSGWYTT